jgi:hypothetical protein
MASPIFYPKSPIDMGGGGAAPAGGADLSALGFVAVDLTDGWTLYDPDGLVDTVAHDSGSGVNTIVMNALGSGSLDYAWAYSATIRAPRWYKALTAPNASDQEQQIVSGDAFTLSTVMHFQEPTDRFATQAVIGSAFNPTSTASADIDLIGGMLQYPTSGNPLAGAFWQQTPSLATANASLDRSFVVHNAAAGRMGTAAYVNVDSSGGFLASGQRAGNSTYSDTSTNLSIVVGLGTASSATITAGEDAKLKVFYRPVRYALP